MRVTKAELQDALRQAAQFNLYRITYIRPSQEYRLRDCPFFVPVAQYGRWMLPLYKEIGSTFGSTIGDHGTRYIEWSAR